MDQINKVHHRNFLENKIPGGKANLIIADPPYYKVKGEFDFIWKTFEDYLQDVEKWAKECKRILAKNGTLFWWGDSKKIAYSQVILDKYFNLLCAPVWDKGDYLNLTQSSELRIFPPASERCLMYSHEDYNLTECITSARDYMREEITKSKGKIVLKEINKVFGTATNGGGVASSVLSLSKSEPGMITQEHYKKLQKWCEPYMAKPYEDLLKEYQEKREQYEETRRPFNNSLRLTEIWKFYNEVTRVKESDHETQKPEKLTTAIIITCSRPGDLVVVPFAGSNTEGAMAAKEGRTFIGYEIEEKHVIQGNNRSRKYLKSPKLFF